MFNFYKQKMPKNEADLKWICRECTYSNWPSAKKCVMCNILCLQNNRWNLVLDETNNDEIINEEIILLSEKNSANNDKNLKWNCPACSYLNWIKSELCIMCKTDKPDEFKLVESLKNIENNAECRSDLKERKTIIKVHKWICIKCTYENWPKAVRCIICQHPRNKNCKPDDFIRQGDKIQNKSTIKKTNRNKTNSPRWSPPRSPTSLQSGNIFDMPTLDESKILNITESFEKMTCQSEVNQRINQICNRLSTKDLMWLAACRGVVEHDIKAVSAYLANGGDRARQLTSDDVLVLNEPQHYETGHTLVHLSIRYHREDILRMLLISEIPHRSVKKLPCHVCPELSMAIRKQLLHSIRTRKGEFNCPFFTELVTFSLPGEILTFDTVLQHQLFKEILDTDVRKVLEEESLINWSSELTNQYGSRLCPLWNRAAGDCLLDSVLQATWGVFDRDNALRKKLFEALSEGQHRFFPRWQEAEEMQASEMNYSLEEQQWKHDWANLVGLSAMAGSSLEQTHVFALAHILRRPIIIYGVKYVKSMRGESIDLARFEGVYLPLLWDVDFCWKNPIALGYTRGHFSALVPMERPSYSSYAGAGAHMEWNEDDTHVTYLPLIDHEGHLLPVHFLTMDEIGLEEQLLQKRLDCCLTDTGILAAKQVITPRPALVSQMIDEWMNRYRKIQAELSESKGASK
ncbi:ubiquitin thioesterase ZRANB1 [Hydra vulgaris]|nr:ubiquitin thioesterase ZRANB1 [Hydra vulgaris]